MKTFDVEVSGSGVVTVQAESAEHARNIVEKMITWEVRDCMTYNVDDAEEVT